MEVSILSDKVLNRVPGTEPSWLQQQRKTAWDQFVNAQIPTKQNEEFRQTDLSLLDLNKFSLNGYLVKRWDFIPQKLRIKTENEELEEAGTLVMEGELPIYHFLDTKWAAKGVILCPLSQALSAHGELIESYLGKLSRGHQWKLKFLQDAAWSGGMFIYVPKGVQITEPLRAMYMSSMAKAAQFPRTLVVMEEGSEATILEELNGQGEGEQLVIPQVELVLNRGAQLNYINVQRLNSESWCFSDQSAQVAQDANLNTLSIFLGGKVTKADVGTTHVGPGGSSKMFGLALGDNKQHFDIHTQQHHVSPDSVSELLYKTALKGKATAIYKGLIRIEQEAQRSNAYQTNRNMLLSETARADSQPKLEIIADDVRCSHGATVGTVDENQLFYLRTRGLDQKEAEQLIVTGFCEDVLKDVQNTTLKEWLMNDLLKKVE